MKRRGSNDNYVAPKWENLQAKPVSHVDGEMEGMERMLSNLLFYLNGA
jgi:hypothetical protein